VLAPSIEVPAPIHRTQAVVAALLVALAVGTALWARAARGR
jgi:hypothetical protein